LTSAPRKTDSAPVLASARREAKSGFGDDRVLIEKYLAAPRHIEIQVFADTHGNAVYLFERDCSVQRRHQKVLEEAPAPDGLSTGARWGTRRSPANGDRLCRRGDRRVHRRGFVRPRRRVLLHGMNTRLQVEHPVTEMVTGEDLVSGSFASRRGSDCRNSRTNSRSPATRSRRESTPRIPSGFLPSIGTITHLRAPATDAAVQVDTGVRAGDEISPYYDPMIAKLIVHGDDRRGALARLRAALADYEIVGSQ
jgi:3-methylcrotonyl-CoA carboxylase alpha subunit